MPFHIFLCYQITSGNNLCEKGQCYEIFYPPFVWFLPIWTFLFIMLKYFWIWFKFRAEICMCKKLRVFIDTVTSDSTVSLTPRSPSSSAVSWTPWSQTFCLVSSGFPLFDWQTVAVNKVFANNLTAGVSKSFKNFKKSVCGYPLP